MKHFVKFPDLGNFMPRRTYIQEFANYSGFEATGGKRNGIVI